MRKKTHQDALIVHFAYHKAMTFFFKKVYFDIARMFNWYHKHHNSDLNGFYEDTLNSKKPAIISVNNRLVDFDRLPPFTGTHLIRDPRDLLISGFRYHKWCKEPWAHETMDAAFVDKFNLDKSIVRQSAMGKTYQEFLNTLNDIEGLKLEMSLRASHFNTMLHWNYKNPNILELKYEDIFGNEIETFERVFLHHGFRRGTIKQCLKIVKKHSFNALKKKGKTGGQKHASKGTTKQWQKLLPDEIKNIFKDKYGDLLIDLGYEKDRNW